MHLGVVHVYAEEEHHRLDMLSHAPRVSVLRKRWGRQGPCRPSKIATAFGISTIRSFIARKGFGGSQSRAQRLEAVVPHLNRYPNTRNTMRETCARSFM